jgi:hypothetical protein
MAEILKAMFKLDEKRMRTSDPVELAEIEIEEEHLRCEYRRIMGVE